jgi:hypothetical protein
VDRGVPADRLRLALARPPRSCRAIFVHGLEVGRRRRPRAPPRPRGGADEFFARGRAYVESITQALPDEADDFGVLTRVTQEDARSRTVAGGSSFEAGYGSTEPAGGRRPFVDTPSIPRYIRSVPPPIANTETSGPHTEAPNSMSSSATRPSPTTRSPAVCTASSRRSMTCRPSASTGFYR